MSERKRENDEENRKKNVWIWQYSLVCLSEVYPWHLSYSICGKKKNEKSLEQARVPAEQENIW